jgi:ComF family protein
MMGLQGLLQLVYPPQCLTCDARVTSDGGLCGACWKDTRFIAGLVCDQCGCPLPGDDPGHRVLCDDCLQTPRPWSHGRSALVYEANARHLVLAMKHGDRLDLVRPAAQWMLEAARPLIQPDTLVVPVPLHWLRLVKRRYNQSALLSQTIARGAGLQHCPDLLRRHRATASQDHRDRVARLQNVAGAISVTPRHAGLVKDRPVLIVDDVMTSGATLSAAAEACHQAGAGTVCVLTLARVPHHDT